MLRNSTIFNVSADSLYAHGLQPGYHRRIKQDRVELIYIHTLIAHLFQFLLELSVFPF